MYNYKIIDYPNGTVQIRYYSKPIITEREEDEFQNCLIDSFDSLVPDTHELTDEKKHKLDVIHKKEEEYIERERALAKYYWDKGNANRAKQKVYEYSRSYDWDFFVTWTFSEKYVDRYNYEDCSKKLRVWLNNQKRNSPDLKYIIVPEKHKNGAWHFHGLIADCSGISIVDSGHTTKSGDIIYNLAKYKYGFTTATVVKDVWRVSKYIGKYITKSVVDSTSGKQRYFVSNNLPKPLETKIFVSDEYNNVEEFVLGYCSKHGMSISYSKTISSEFRDISYVELQYKE